MNETLLERKNERIREFGGKVESRNWAIAEIERKFSDITSKISTKDFTKH